MMEATHLKAMHALTSASNANRCAWDKEKKSMQAEMEQMDSDFRDTLQANKDEITRLIECKYRLEAENKLLTSTLNGVAGDEMREHAQDVFEEVQRMRKELEKTYTDLKIFNEKVENVLEAMQQQRDHWEAHSDKEKEAQAQLYDLQKQIVELQEKLAVRDELLRAADDTKNDSVTMDGDSLLRIALMNDDLHEELQVFRGENAKLQAKANKTYDENFELCLKLDTMEDDLHHVRSNLEVLEHKQSILLKEREFLINAVRNHQVLTEEDKAPLQQHLYETTDDNEDLRARNDELAKEVASLYNYIKTIHNKAQDEIDKTAKEAEYWETLYWKEAVPKVETLLKEIHQLNQELGHNDIHVQDRLERNIVVADRNALRYACAITLRSVD
jgi:methyl-accepting chemotaxis protein